MTDYQKIKQELLDIFEFRSKFYSDLDNLLDKEVFKNLITYLFSPELDNYPETITFGNKEKQRVISHAPTNVTTLLFEIISLCRISAEERLFAQIKQTRSTVDNQTLTILADSPVGGLSTLLLVDGHLGKIIQQLLIYLFPVVEEKSQWLIIPLEHRGLLIGYVFVDNQVDQEILQQAKNYCFPEFQLYEDQVLDDVSARFIRQLKFLGGCKDDSFPLVFLYTSKNNGFYLSGLKENLQHIRPICSQIGLKKFKNTLLDAITSSKKIPPNISLSMVESNIFNFNHVFNQLSAQINEIQEYMFQRAYRKALNSYLDEPLAYSLVPNLHFCLSYNAVFLWDMSFPKEPVCQRGYGYIYNNNAQEYVLDNLIAEQNELLVTQPYKKKLYDFWKSDSLVPVLEQSDKDLSILMTHYVGSEQASEQPVSYSRLRVAIRPLEDDSLSEPAIIEIYFNNANTQFACQADEVIQFINKSLVLGQKIKLEMKALAEKEAKAAEDKTKLKIALGIKHEIGKLIDNAAMCLQRQKYSQAKWALTIMRSRIKSIDKDGQIDIGDGVEGEVDIKQFFEDFINPTAKPMKKDFSERPSQVEVIFVDEENWQVSISEAAFYAVWNNFWRNAFDVLTVYSWPEENKVDSKERLYQRVIECEKKWGTFESRHKKIPSPKLLILFRIVEGGQSISFEMIDNAPELAGGEIEYMSSQDNIAHFGTNVLTNIKNRLLEKGVYCRYESAHALSPEEVADIYQSVHDQQVLDKLALKSLMWSCVRFVIERKGHDV